MSDGARLTGIDHVHLTMPPGLEAEAAARRFYAVTLGLDEVEKPEVLQPRGGRWFQGRGFQVHLGIEARIETRRHPAFVTDDLEATRGHVQRAGYAVVDDAGLPGIRRFYVSDPFANRIEVQQYEQADRAEGATGALFLRAQKLVSAAALFVDAEERMLVLAHTYNTDWGMPGGLADPGEPPRAACDREIREELGLDRGAGALLSVEWRPPRALHGDGLHFIFWGGRLSVAEVAAIRLPAEELSAFAFLPLAEALVRLPGRGRASVAAAYEVRPDGPPVYLEAGERDRRLA